MKDERFFWGDLHPVCVLRGLLYNLWVLILAVLTAGPVSYTHLTLPTICSV